MGRVSPAEKQARRMMSVLTSASDQTHMLLLEHAEVLADRGEDWISELRAILRKPPEEWDGVERALVNTFVVYGAQSFARSMAVAKVEELELLSEDYQGGSEK